MIATRLYAPERFSMTAGANVPVDRGMIGDLEAELPRRLSEGTLAAMIDDRHFAEAVYRVGLADGITDRILCQDPADA